MDKLPPEIWHKIFICLDLDIRLECMIICRSWWRILDKYSLFHNVEIVYKREEFTKLMEMFMRSPHHAAQVEEMRLLSCLDTSFNKRTLLNMFPNLRVLKVEWDLGWIRQSEESSYFSEPIEIIRSKSKIKVLHDSVHCELASQILASNLCGRLEELELNFVNTSDIKTRAVLDQLKDVPTLKTLTLEALSIGINNLENIHESLLALQEFNLIYVFINASNMPSDIIPATSITSSEIRIVQVDDIDTHIQFYQYMLKKYTKTTVVDYYDSQITGYSFIDAKQVYLNGILDFYKLTTSKKKELNLHGFPDGVNIFEVLDVADCRLEKVTASQYENGAIYQYLAQSNQSKYVQKLRLSNTDIGSLHVLKNMMALTTLELDFYGFADYTTASITHYLNDCPPSVRTFSISDADLKIDLATTRPSSIEKLTISCKDITKDLGNVISNCFPKLVELGLNGVLDENVNIALQSSSFKSANIIVRTSEYGFSFASPSQAEPECYRCSMSEKVRASYEDMQFLPTLSVVTSTDKKLKLDISIEILSV
ncbi:hypothetical protein K501DRAFT_266253 [Backusella circina FSU 941]|nr:hypothetical protein K501DRAFT_266253 [Backusella circina FSU 941]